MYANKQQQINMLQKQIHDINQIPNPKVRATPIPQTPRHRSAKPTQILTKPKLGVPKLTPIRTNEPNDRGD